MDRAIAYELDLLFAAAGADRYRPGGATSIDITREGVDKAYGLKKLRDASRIALDDMMLIGDALFPGGNDYPAKEMCLNKVRVRDPEEPLAVIAAIVACQK